MSKRQVIILWIIAAVLAATVAVVKISQGDPTQTTTARAPGETLFESFPAADISHIVIKDASHTTTLARTDSGWAVAERDNYPADVQNVLEFLRNVENVEITQGIEAGESFAPRFGMDANASTNEQHGTTAIFSDASGKELAQVTLGKNIEQNPGGMPASALVGRYIRNHADSTGFYATSQMFPAVSAEPQRWLDDRFFSLEKIKAITLSKKDGSDPEWSLARDSEDGEFKLLEAAAGEIANSTNTGPLKSLLSYARFDDVVPTAQLDKRRAENGTQTATIETFEGFTYTLTLTPDKGGANKLLTLTVDAKLPETRKKQDNESPEDAKSRDEAFTKRLKELQDKLAKEKALEGRTFVVSNATLSALLKPRSDIASKAEATDTPKDQAVTPPIPLKPAQP